MSREAEQLVREVMELTGAPAPPMLAEDAPVLSDDALAVDQHEFYLIGIIGGKDVGKSALVNALVGEPITAITSHGAGTEIVVAYTHKSQEARLAELLEREVPGRYRIVTHKHEHLRSQVLLDLPDIDSRWESHLQVTRSMLRHMLYPIWVQSIEKYADRQPQQMLAQVAEGNAPENFLFCLNKVDQLGENEKSAQAVAAQLREDFSGRIAKTLKLAAAPSVFAISALHPARHDLPALRERLARQKDQQTVRQSVGLALQRQNQSLLEWLSTQQVDLRLARLERLYEEAQELMAARVGTPLLEKTIPMMVDDAAYRAQLSDEVLRIRVSRWPLVRLVHTLLSPLLSLWRANLGPMAGVGRGTDGIVESYLIADGRGVASGVQSAFAMLRQSNTAIAALYEQNKLWEDMPSDAAASQLSGALSDMLARQRDVAVQRLGGKDGPISGLFRWLLTIGALLWFPFVQPVLEKFLVNPGVSSTPRQIAALVVSIFSGAYLLKNVTFLIVWFTVIWLALRWNTQRRVSRLLTRWAAGSEPSLSLATQCIQWLDELVGPIDRARERTARLAERIKSLESQVTADAA